MGAPVCFIPVDENITQPAAKLLAQVPQATDLQSALRAINAMRAALMALMNGLNNPQSRNSGEFNGTNGPIGFGGGGFGNLGPGGSQNRGGGGPGGGIFNLKIKNNPETGRWSEIPQARITEVVRIFNPKDKSQWVDVERINATTFQDTVTGEQFFWQRGNTGNQGT